MTTEIFADSLGRIDFAGGVVRFELAVLEPTDDGKGKLAARQRVVMPIEGFLNTYKIMGELIAKMEEGGVIRRSATPTQ